MDRTFEAMLVRQCAPTLAGLKPGSPVLYYGGGLRERAEEGTVLGPAPGGPRPVCPCTAGAERGRLRLGVCVPRQPARAVPRSDGSPRFSGGDGVQGERDRANADQLAGRLSGPIGFPHEIGVFLGYPLRDVVGFIENRGQNFTCCGFWKSYSDPNTIQRCFACYRQCVNIYVRMYERGIPIEKMVIAA